jgi:hypothetical protein
LQECSHSYNRRSCSNAIFYMQEGDSLTLVCAIVLSEFFS